MPRQAQDDSDPIAAVMNFLRPAAPLVAPPAASLLTFGIGLTAAQGVGMVLRVSSATPVLGSALGMLGVGAASAAAGQAFRKVRLGFERGGPSPLAWPPWQGVQRQDLLVDAVGGLLIWRALGGRWSSTMPSDLFHPGSMARRSIPASTRPAGRGGKGFAPMYGNQRQLATIGKYFRSDGCHHCGRRSGQAIADHIPPNVKVYGSGYKEALLSEKAGSSGAAVKGIMKTLGVQRPNEQVTELVSLFDAATRRKVAAARRAAGQRTQRFGFFQRAVRRVRKLLRLPVGPPVQRLYPQCRACSVKQARAARVGRRTLVFCHGGLTRPRLHHLAGVAMGWRYLQTDGGGGGRGSKRKPKKGGGGPKWWKPYEAPTLPPPIRGSSGGSYW